MGDLAANMRERVSTARWNLEQARAEGDDYSADSYASELEDLLSRAAEQQIDLTDASGPQSAAGVPAAGPVTGR